jgi:hypothetical protein
VGGIFHEYGFSILKDVGGEVRGEGVDGGEW